MCFVPIQASAIRPILTSSFFVALDLHIAIWTSQQPFFGQRTRKIENKLSTQQTIKPKKQTKKDDYAHKTIQHQPEGKIYLIVKFGFCHFRQKYA